VLRARLHLAAPDAFRYLARGCTQYFGSEAAGADRLSANQRKYGRLKDAMLDDAADFGRVDRGLASIGLDQEERFSVYTTIAAVLHLGNIEFQVSKVNILYENLYIKKPTSIATSFELYPFQYVNTSPTPHLTRPTRK
jgi:hypothetical protein